jgi:hypothetical protein
VTQNLKLGVWEGRLWAQGNPKSVVGEASVRPIILDKSQY